MRKIAITGSIGSGKSTVSRWLRQQGWEVFDCDAASRTIMLPNQKAYAQIIQRFPDVVDNNGLIDRKKLAECVFNEEKKRIELENITHPAILHLMEEAMDPKKSFFFAEVPLLYETGWEKYFDEVLLIRVNEEVRKKRLMSDRLMSEAEIKARLDAQLSDEIKAASASWVIDNNADEAALARRLSQWLKSITE